MRIRTIKPEWLSSQKLAGASDAARVLSVALVLLSDDHGRGRGSIPEIAMQAWRYEMTRDDCANARETLAKVRETLAELSATGFVVLYQVDGDDFFELPGWASHQRVDKPGKSKIPPRCQRAENTPETLAKVPETLATDQGSGIMDQGVGEHALASPMTAHEMLGKPKPPPSLMSQLVEAMSQETFEIAKERNEAPPREAHSMWDGWRVVAAYVRDTAAARGWDGPEAVQNARALLRAFYASEDPKTKRAAYKLSFLKGNPAQYAAEARKVAA